MSLLGIGNEKITSKGSGLYSSKKLQWCSLRWTCTQWAKSRNHTSIFIYRLHHSLHTLCHIWNRTRYTRSVSPLSVAFTSAVSSSPMLSKRGIWWLTISLIANDLLVLLLKQTFWFAWRKTWMISMILQNEDQNCTVRWALNTGGHTNTKLYLFGRARLMFNQHSSQFSTATLFSMSSNSSIRYSFPYLQLRFQDQYLRKMFAIKQEQIK